MNAVTDCVGDQQDPSLAAIIGVACKLPGADSVDSFWKLLLSEGHGIAARPAGRWSVERFLRPGNPESGFAYTFAGGYIDNPYAFDPTPFGISPREAQQMDPQQRVLLETVWSALEDGGLAPSSLAKQNIGVYVGASTVDYQSGASHDPAVMESHFMTGNSLSILSNRISYAFDLCGPSLTVDSACSSSVTALSLAVDALRAGEVDMAIVAGVNLLLSPAPFIGFSQARMLSPTGRSRPFSADADGYVRSEGAVVFVLQRLEDAQASGSRVRGVIAGVATNSDGRTSGISLPSVEGQKSVIERLYAQTGIDPEALAFVEAHGTGTKVGDPIEASAIGEALARRRSRPLPIGSVKSNIGHLEAASGLAGLLKALLALEHGILPRSLFTENLNPAIDFDGLNLAPVGEALRLDGANGPLVAGVCNYGFGGTNAHIILRGPEPLALPAASGRDESSPASAQLLLVSAASPQALRLRAADVADAIEAGASVDEVAAGLGFQHELMDCRLGVQTARRGDVAAQLRHFAAHGEPSPHLSAAASATAASQRLVFVFSGNGAQFADMGRAAYATSAAFRAEIAALDRAFQPLGGWSIAELLRDGVPPERLARSSVNQPLIYAIQSALGAVLAASGVRPHAVIGHSVGEVAAAEACGALSREDALRVVYLRSRHQEAVQGQGGMLVLAADAVRASALLADFGDPAISIAAINSPGSTTVSGATHSLRAFARHCRLARLATKELDIDYPFHSPALDPIGPAIVQGLAGLAPHAPQSCMISTVTGRALGNEKLDGDYWWRNVREPVRFEAAMGEAIEMGLRAFIEIGPRSILSGPIADILRARNIEGLVLPTLSPHDSEAADPVLLALARLVVHGAAFDPLSLFGQKPARLVALPGYPFQRQTYNLPGTSEALDAFGRMWDAPPRHPLLGARLANGSPEWRSLIDPALVPYLNDHRVQGNVIVPATALIDMALAVGRDVFGDTALELDDFDIFKALALQPGDMRELSSRFADQTGTIEIWSRKRFAQDGWILHARGCLRPLKRAPDACLAPPVAAETIVDTPAEVYAQAARAGLEYGPLFQIVTHNLRDRVTTQTALAAPAGGLGAFGDGHVLHPVSMDGAFHGLFISRPQREGEMKAHLPVRFRKIRVWSPGARIARSITLLTHETKASKTISASLLGEDGTLVASVEAAVLRAVHLSASSIFERTFRTAPVPLMHAPMRDAFDLLQAQLSQTAVTTPPVWLLMRAFAVSLAHRVARNLSGDDSSRLDQAVTRGRVVLTAVPLFGILQDVLRNFGALTADEAGARLADSLALPAPEIILSTLIKQFPEANAEIRLAADALAHLENVLRTGAFVPPKMATSERLDSSGVIFRPALEALGASISMLRARAGQPLRVLALAPFGSGLRHALMPFVLEGSIELVIATSDAVQAEDYRRALGDAPIEVLPLDEAALTTPLTFDTLVLGNRLGANAGVCVQLLAKARARLASAAPVLALTCDHDPALDLLCGIWGASEHNVRVDADHVLQHLRQADFHDLAVHRTSDGFSRLIVGRAGLAHKGLSEGPVAVLGDLDLQAYALPGARRIDAGDRFADLGRWLSMTPHADAPTLLVQLPASAGSAANQVAERIEYLKALFGELESLERSPKVFVLTTGAHDGDGPHAPREAAIWGFVRVAINEYAGLDLRLIDMASDAPRQALAQVLAQPGLEREWILTRNGASANRIGRGLAQRADVDEHCRTDLQFDKPGRLDSFVWRMAARRALEPDEVEVEIAAAGLNYRDILVGLAAIDDDLLGAGLTRAALGFECSGTIVRVGSGVAHFSPGDRVAGFGAGTFTSHLVAPAANFFPVPDKLSLEAAATIPVAFATAWYALVDRANLQAGETVLIHGAAGGVGLAAIQIARLKGAHVIGTASSSERRTLAYAAGADEVFPSRNESFVEPIEKTLGGVDVVLNSLAGAAMIASLKLVRPFGRFIELGKRDFLENTPLGLRPFVRNISYAGVDLDELLAHDPKRVHAIMAMLCDLFATGALSPLPYQAYESHDIDAAFRSMQASEHVGKIIFKPARSGDCDFDALTFSANPGAYIIVGGTSGLGFATARWLAARGAQTIVLASRRGLIDEALAPELAAMQARGTRVYVETLDVVDGEAVASLVQRISRAHGGVRGVIHAAVTLDDGLINSLDPQRLRAVLRTKIEGALHLDAATRDEPLDFFVVYSSATTVIGSPGQAAYVAANAFLEGFARRRRALGRPALAIGWGAISDTGLIARDKQLGERLRRTTGVAGITSSDALAHLGRLLALGNAIDPVQFYTNIAPVAAAAKLNLLTSPAFASLGLARVEDLGEGARDLAAAVRGTERGEALAIVTQALRREVAHILRMSEAQIDPTRQLSELGLDSLMALELHMSIETLSGAQAPMIGAGDLRLCDLAGTVLAQIVDDTQTSDPDAPDYIQAEIEALAKAHASGDGRSAQSRAAGDHQPLLAAGQ